MEKTTAIDLIEKLPDAARDINPITIRPFELMELLDDVHHICAGLVSEGCPMNDDLATILIRPVDVNVHLSETASEAMNARDFMLRNYETVKAAVSIAGIVAKYAAHYVEDCACHIDEAESTIREFVEREEA